MSVRGWTYPQTITCICCVVPIFFGLKIYKPVSFLFPFVSDDGNGSETKESKYKIGLKIFNPPKNWNYSAYFIYYQFISWYYCYNTPTISQLILISSILSSRLHTRFMVCLNRAPDLGDLAVTFPNKRITTICGLWPFLSTPKIPTVNTITVNYLIVWLCL